MTTPTGKVLGIDPGTTTGIACVKYHLSTFATTERPMFQRMPQVSWVADCASPFDTLRDTLRSAHPDTVIVVESTPTHGRNSGKAHVDEVVALVNAYDRGNVVWVAPSFWKGQPAVKRVLDSFKEPSSIHARDALGMAVAMGHRTFILGKPPRSK